MNREHPFFPVQTETRDGAQTLYSNTIVGGVTAREYFALTLFASMMANPAFVASKISAAQLRGSAIEQADKLIAELGEEK